MTNEKLEQMNELSEKIECKKRALENLNNRIESGNKISLLSFYKGELYLNVFELQMIKTRLQMELDELEKEFEAL